MLYIEVHEELPDHPKTIEAAKRLRMDPLKLVGHLVKLWLWALKYAPDGDLKRFSPAQIASGAGLENDAKTSKKFINALLRCGGRGKPGFIEMQKGGPPSSILLHDWGQYGGKLLRARSLAKERMARARSQHVTRTQRPRSVLEESRVEESRVEGEAPDFSSGISTSDLTGEWLDVTPEEMNYREDVQKRMNWLVHKYGVKPDEILDVIQDPDRRPKNRFKLVDYFKADGQNKKPPKVKSNIQRREPILNTTHILKGGQQIPVNGNHYSTLWGIHFADDCDDPSKCTVGEPIAEVIGG